MAHIAKLGALTDELITLISSITVKSDPKAFNAHRESALRLFRHNVFPRTNQFDVTSSLDGLEEKFRVYNEDPIADALRERLNKVAKFETKWTPEILHLLLELSDQPVTNSKLEDLEFLKEPEVNKGPPLQWLELAKEDPLLREKSVWRNVDFATESGSEDDGFEDSRSDIGGTEDTIQSSVDEEFQRRPEDYAIGAGNREDLGKLKDSQFWNKTPSVGGVKLETVKKTVTELQAVREVLFMLGGYPTSLFTLDSDDGFLKPSKGYALKHASHDAYYTLMESFAESGSAIKHLRIWSKHVQDTPLLQVFQGVVSKRIDALDTLLSNIQSRFVALKQDTSVSLLSIQQEISSLTRLLSCLALLTKNLESDRNRHAFRYLELLYDKLCTAQMAGDDEMYCSIGKIFFECFQVYLQPIRVWMEDGELIQGDKGFFVSEIAGEVELASLWESRFNIRKTRDGILHAPRFLHAAASKIFTTGKSVVVLKHLNQFQRLQSARLNYEPLLYFDTVCNPKELQLAPFPELFDTAFDAWVQSKHHQASSMLRKMLFDSCGLHTSLKALSYIYFIADGITGANFTNTVFYKLDTLDPSWNDRFTLTELAQSTFGSIATVAPDRLRTSVLTLARKHQDVAKCRRTVKVLAILEMRYQLSWPIQIIVTPATVSAYKRIFTFLLQVRRSSHMLSRQRLVTDRLMDTNSLDERALYYSLRMRLLWFTQILCYYLTSLVLEPSSQKMHVDLRAAEDVDRMIEVHSNFVKSTIDQALLGSKLEPIHKTIMKLLDLAIKLEDNQAAHAAADKEAAENQREMIGRSVASLGLHSTPRPKKTSMFMKSIREQNLDSSDDEDDQEVDVDLSILSSNFEDSKEEVSYVDKLRTMKADFDRMVRFVASGLKGVARAGSGAETRSWDILGEMLENGLDNGSRGFW